MSEQYAHYSINDFDNFDCLKISKGIYAILLFVLRGYIIWLMSVTNMNDRVSIIQWIYPEPKYFYLSLCSGVIGLYIVLVMSLRRPNAHQWVRTSWRYLRVILLSALVFDLIVTIIASIYWQHALLSWLIMDSVLLLVSGVFLFRSKRVQINVNEFPEELAK